MALFKLSSVCFLASVSTALRVAVLSDIHLQPFYDQTLDNNTYCQSHFVDKKVKPRKADKIAPLGRIGCDPPQILVE